MAEALEKRGFGLSDDHDVHSNEATDMYHAVIKDTRQEFLTEGKDVDDMYRMGKEQQFKVGRFLSSNTGISN